MCLPSMKRTDSMDSQQRGETVTITANQPWSGITIHLHARGAVVFGTVIDKTTGTKIDGARLHYTEPDTTGGGGGSMLV